MANEERELYKFVNDSKYRDKVIAKIHKNDDNAYNKRIKQIEKERDVLSNVRRHIVVGANCILFSVYRPTRLCRIGTYRRF